MSSDLVIVYHRQPYEEVEENGQIVRKENKSPNGIVPTLKSFFRRVDKGAWVAWKLSETPNEPDFDRVIEIEDSYGTYSVSRLPLTEAQVKSFYHVTSKEAFWPILHSFKEKYDYDPVDWPTFREVNWAFAEAAANEAAEGAVVWVHDYNLWLVPGYLRKMRPDLRISFFHHTPFPSADMFNVLPWRREIMESLLSCDVVGFHIPRYAANFVGVAESLFSIETGPREPVNPDFVKEYVALSDRKVAQWVENEGRRVQVLASPVGVDVDYIEGKAGTEDTLARAQQIRTEMGDGAMILSVGRTDYTKGGADQLMSFERILAENPDLHGKVRLMHVSVSANRNMAVYESIQSEIEEFVGRINGRFGTFDWTPVTLMSRAIPFDELVAYYRAADVCWITPLADGMNLVAKEFAACRADLRGALVLSEFAGAAIEMGSAVLANPFSHKSMDRALLQALNMGEEEQENRMRDMRDTIRKYDIRAWAEDQMAGFSGIDAAP
ncbi:glucosylglycerol-phosphate synthase [Palleronia marisminoris]|uniref:Glucosylglycerol-phosphate synthase n=1 Tax=Palleronia marisminoris TaxID=315423 RepID=A0A1Y5RWR9_9RHOB|nr:glucosylglycerol-phosphate synthase [Palleronia marisminoris]SFG50450.1 glucosylglycerol-phosphate synthase [Palleronia marisminoris]SLN24663.1 Glucosylglycerol-phosphate synthase [Palleronia marisminoris]